MDRDETTATAEATAETIAEPKVEPESLSPPKATKARTPDRGPFFTEIWQGRPIYRCPICRIAKTDRAGVSGDTAVRSHIEQHHATARPTPEDQARAAGLVIPKR